MRKKILHEAKLIVKVRGNKKTKRVETVSVFDNRTQNFWSLERIKERGILEFLHVEDMKESLNWNLNGDSRKFQFKWGQSSKTETEGIAYVFD